MLDSPFALASRKRPVRLLAWHVPSGLLASPQQAEISQHMKTILFDLDGTLLDHFRAIHLAIAHSQRQLGLPESTYQTVRATVGGGVEVTLGRLIGPENVDAAMPYFESHFGEIMLSEAEMLPGSICLLQALHARGKQLAVFTNKGGEHSRTILEHFKVAVYLAEIFGTGDTAYRKPQPEFSEHALKCLNARAEDTIMIGDSPFDYAAAEAGGFKCYLVATGSHTVEQLAKETNAAGIYKDLYELARDLFELEAQAICV